MAYIPPPVPLGGFMQTHAPHRLTPHHAFPLSHFPSVEHKHRSGPEAPGRVYLASWLARSNDSLSDALRTALDTQQQFETVSSVLRQLSKDPGIQQDAAKALTGAVATLEASTAVLRELLSAVAQPHFYNERHSPASSPSRMQDVLDLPELLEAVLSFLDVRDVLRMQQVSKACFAGVEHSPGLQYKLGLRNDAAAFLRLPIHNSDDFPGYWCEFTIRRPRPGMKLDPPAAMGYVRHNGMVITRHIPTHGAVAEANEANEAAAVLMASFSTQGRGALPAIGDRYKRMASNTPLGLTIGDLYDFAAMLVPAHRLCPDAALHALDPDGYAMVSVVFEGGVKLRSDDPVLGSLGVHEQPSDSLQADAPRTHRLQAYTTAKQTARDRHEDIPTLAEWEATLPPGWEPTVEPPLTDWGMQSGMRYRRSNQALALT
ncbi:hypothetical protein LTR36_008872 [Oleoguttula mirabilis]|uniref:F-box domain-containing protein n=1 Tax=Oleoguttula mirabilis TaxID=1507867 RepID=A0AAV9J7X0_9PEZI|nr:hypothetical protein LTR36_008872 [Oleoguttula mirabilis]